MTIIPDKAVTLAARTDADFEQPFEFWDDEAQTVATDLTGWTFRFVAKRDELDAADWLVAEGAAITVNANSVTATIEQATLAAALNADEKRVQGVWALQGTGPSDKDAAWAGGPFVLMRGL